MLSPSSKLEAKENFKRLIVQHKGDAANPEVKFALDELVRLAVDEREDCVDGADARSPAAARSNEGRWKSITTPPFPGKLPDDATGKSKFTLGRMSFGMFKPTKLVCAVEDIFNILHPVDEKEGGLLSNGITGRRRSSLASPVDAPPTWMQTYDLEVMIEIETPTAKLPARLTNYGFCFPETPTRLAIKFSEGKLEPRFDLSSPADAALSAAWKEIFDNAITKEAEAQSHLGRLATWATYKLMNAMMGLEPPTDNSVDFTQIYKIGRPYKGHIDIVYLDKDLRVTRGNAGTIVVVERVLE
jgi:hypothetical protein